MNTEKFNLEKATEMAYIIINALSAQSKSITYLKLMKMMYLCDRYMFELHGKFITNDDYILLEKGPALSGVLSTIKETHSTNENSYWHKHIQREKKRVKITNPINKLVYLDPEESRVIELNIDIFGKYKKDQLIDIVHVLCDEWYNPKTKGFKKITLSPEKIQQAINSELDPNDAYGFLL